MDPEHGVREAVRKWDATRSYVNRRLAGVPTRQELNKDRQALSPLLEAQLAHWAIGQARLGFAPALVKFRSMAQRMLNASGTSYQLGQRWHARFLARNGDVKATRSRIINYNRVNGATAANINVFFDRLDAPELANIPPERFYNTDEMGIGQGVGGDHWVISEATSHMALKKDVEKGEWITALECVSCDGVALPPLVIFKGADVQSQWFPNQNRHLWDDWRFKVSARGWTSNATALNWIEDIFIPHIRSLHGNKWVVLVCDGHESHTNDDLLWLCLSNKIWLVFYEPHCSHVVQVLDVGVFGLLKRRLRRLLRECPNTVLGLKPTKMDMLEVYRQARIDVLTLSIIRNAWRTAGIYLRDRSKPLSSRYVILEDVGVARVCSRAPEVVERELTPDFVAELAPTPIKTPSGGQALRRSGRQLAALDPTFKLPSQRLFVRKASKALDQQADKIASLEAQIDYLQSKLDRKTARVRQKVRIAPGQRFVRMADIRRAKRRLRGRVVYEDEASDIEVPGGPRNANEIIEGDGTEAEDCIIVGNTRR
ncbi:transposase [Apiospora kogelbergensis]|uniref:transposase n=1 Tax=Apiospora kogelbergensis TaxID=1337665 RepID=UPI003130F633